MENMTKKAFNIVSFPICLVVFGIQWVRKSISYLFRGDSKSRKAVVLGVYIGTYLLIRFCMPVFIVMAGGVILFFAKVYVENQRSYEMRQKVRARKVHKRVAQLTKMEDEKSNSGKCKPVVEPRVKERKYSKEDKEPVREKETSKIDVQLDNIETKKTTEFDDSIYGGMNTLIYKEACEFYGIRRKNLNISKSEIDSWGLTSIVWKWR